MNMTSRRYLFHLLLHSADLLDEELTRRLKPLGIGPRQARVIEGLGRMGEVSQAQLARAFRITQASMSTMTSRLIAGGYIARKPDPKDSRGNLLFLSEEGRALLSEIDRIWASMDDFAAEAIGQDRYKALAQEAGALRDALGGKRPGE
ncbi:DNA-binding transcriptional regulator, MarR family [Poseidonocella pacifica]|uniref:DNA-binding transcriptional regulator, MarR family n=1 Tax=Poseidonocella pacifica TaxID=871651 RepID=A0A1I0Y5N2_9RHOB|nr:MarR family transcriptional regulator [Poseidonocella pacifica]SFB08542.1 DNA-binding transcriptional regulator, MarR family [Poseidonocella pacifica]